MTDYDDLQHDADQDYHDRQDAGDALDPEDYMVALDPNQSDEDWQMGVLKALHAIAADFTTADDPTGGDEFLKGFWAREAEAPIF